MRCRVLKKVIIAGQLYTPVENNLFDVDQVDPAKLVQLINLRYLSTPEPAPEVPETPPVEPRSKKLK